MKQPGRFEKAFQILSDRSVYESKQRLYWLMLHDGLRRINKPFPTAADLHFPLIDTQITNLKPFYVAQVFGGERLSDFLAMRDQLSDTTEAAADYFTFELKHNSDYRYQFEIAMFYMLLRGRGVLKSVYDPVEQRIKKRAIDPLYILMAQTEDDFTNSDGSPAADGWTEIERMSVGKYKRNPNYNQDPEVLRAIRGREDWSSGNIGTLLDKQLREGVTFSKKEDEIVLWHDWETIPSGWKVTTYSPQAFDQKIRAPFISPYKAGGKPSCPFVSFPRELKDAGWYSPRGIAELNAAFEAYMTKTWNNRSDAMTFGNTPMFTSPNDIQNVANIKFLPGEFIPGGISAVQMPQPAISFSEEINFTRELAEQRAKTPDFGITNDGQKQDPRTATENNRIAGLQNVGMDHNGDLLRINVQKLYKHDWGMMVQFQKPKMTYFVADNLKELPVQALHDEYLVIPDGGAGTKSERLQRALARKQVFNGQPNIDQDELAKGVLAADDSRLISKLLIPSNQKQQSESFQEDVEISVMEMGRPVPVLPGQDHATRIMELMGYLHAQTVKGAPVNPQAKVLIQQHLAQHFQYLQSTNPEAAKQIKQSIAQMEQAPVAPQGQGGGPPNGTGMPGGTPPGPATSTGTEQPKSPSESISVKLGDLYPSERTQALKMFGITAAQPEEIQGVEVARAHLKSINSQSKEKIQGPLT